MSKSKSGQGRRQQKYRPAARLATPMNLPKSNYGSEGRGGFQTRPYIITSLVPFAVVGIVAFLYLASGLSASGGGTPVLPLDDAYIHFQYARVMAEGQPLRYNPGQPATSGATSLLYPPILGVGYFLGFQGERLAWWALAIGVLTWLGSTWMVYWIAASNGGPYANWIGLAIAAAFVLCGSLGWAFMSGMETGLFIFTTLLTFWHVVRGDTRSALITGAVAALTRPEGAVIGVLAAFYLGLRDRGSVRAQFPLYLLPFVAALAQPLYNLAQTGSLVASGMQAKSYLYNVPPDPGVVLSSIINTAVRIWTELFSGYSPDDGEYRTTVLVLAAGLTIVVGVLNAVRSRRLNTSVLVLGWLFGLTLTVALLETAFWQFKRYQQPMIALLFPMAAWPFASLTRYIQQYRQPRGQTNLVRLFALAALALLVSDSVRTLSVFTRHYADNVREIASSQAPMARYVAEKLPSDAIVGVHDIGMMRYLGGRTTYDVIGLTTPSAALPFRNGPGAAFEQMKISLYRPTYFAIYPDARGLTYFADTSLFGEKLAEFPSTKPTRNVASATNSGQAIYKANWTYAEKGNLPKQIIPASNFALKDSVNVANLDSENQHGYRWWEAARRPGFPTELYEMDYISCHTAQVSPEIPCKTLDGGRLITGGEEMTIETMPGEGILWITRVHPRDPVILGVYANGKRIGTRVIPRVPGQWLEFATLIPGNLITGGRTLVRIEANINDPNAGHYMPYFHWFYSGTFRPDTTIKYPAPPVTFGQFVQLVGRRVMYNGEKRSITVDLEWQAPTDAPFDAVTFVHLYGPDGKLIEDQGAQIDRRPGEGALPPANWLPGTVRDSYTLIVPGELAPGTYQVAVGLYDPVTMTRYRAEGEGVESEDRLFIGEVAVK